MRPGTGYISRNSSRRRLLGNGVRTLKPQIILALGLMTSLFAEAILYALHIVDHQRADDEMLRMGGELRLLLQQVSMQAMSYKKNAPRDYDAYFRDTRLYYQDLLSKRDQLEAIIEAFAQKRILPAAMSHHASRSPLNLSDRSRRLAIELQSAWRDFTRVLDDKLGDPVEPRLEWGAEWILERHPTLQKAAEAFLESLEHEVEARATRAHNIGRLLLTTGLVAGLLVLLWFYRRVLRPLQTAVDGFRIVATGDFSHRVRSNEDNEIGWLISAFNQLTERLDALLELLTALQQSKTLDKSLETLSVALPRLVPIDWAAMLLLTPGGRMQLARAYSDGEPDDFAERAFKLEGTLLEECLHNGSPLHIPNVLVLMPIYSDPPMANNFDPPIGAFRAMWPYPFRRFLTRATGGTFEGVGCDSQDQGTTQRGSRTEHPVDRPRAGHLPQYRPQVPAHGRGRHRRAAGEPDPAQAAG